MTTYRSNSATPDLHSFVRAASAGAIAVYLLACCSPRSGHHKQPSIPSMWFAGATITSVRARERVRSAANPCPAVTLNGRAPPLQWNETSPEGGHPPAVAHSLTVHHTALVRRNQPMTPQLANAGRAVPKHSPKPGHPESPGQTGWLTQRMRHGTQIPQLLGLRVHVIAVIEKFTRRQKLGDLSIVCYGPNHVGDHRPQIGR